MPACIATFQSHARQFLCLSCANGQALCIPRPPLGIFYTNPRAILEHPKLGMYQSAFLFFLVQKSAPHSTGWQHSHHLRLSALQDRLDATHFEVNSVESLALKRRGRSPDLALAGIHVHTQRGGRLPGSSFLREGSCAPALGPR